MTQALSPDRRCRSTVGNICIEGDSVTGGTPYHPPVKRSVTINGHQTSISLEPLFWDMLKRAADARGQAVNALVAMIDADRIKSTTPPGLAGAIRIWLVASNGLSD
jgi:predicted DNA-binding ribbon-helix-helix protein